MPRKMTINSLLAKLQTQIAEISKLSPEEAEADVYKRTLEKARGLAYLCQVASSIIEKHELEKKVDELAAEIESLKCQRNP